MFIKKYIYSMKIRLFFFGIRHEKNLIFKVIIIRKSLIKFVKIFLLDEGFSIEISLNFNYFIKDLSIFQLIYSLIHA